VIEHLPRIPKALGLLLALAKKQPGNGGLIPILLATWKAEIGKNYSLRSARPNSSRPHLQNKQSKNGLNV
jgi:hypothetical protein